MRIFIALLAALMAACPALCETAPEVFPGVAEYEEIVSDELLDGMRMTVLRLATGEEIMLSMSAETGEAYEMHTSQPAGSPSEDVQERGSAEETALFQYPDALLIAYDQGNDGSLRVWLITRELAGNVCVQGDMILSRGFSFGAFLDDGGLLTMDGARQALRMLRPETECREIELDEDDGMLLYEGEAYVDGVEYEFELNARTGRLTEWERD